MFPVFNPGPGLTRDSPDRRSFPFVNLLMQGWFDLSTLDKLTDPSSEDVPGLNASSNALQALIAQNALDLDPKRIVVGGFSQGCAVGLLAGLTKGDEGREREVERNVAGVVGSSPPPSPCFAWADPLLSFDTALSGWLPLRTTVKEHLHARATDLPVFWGHGRSDQVVAYDCPSPVLPSPSFPSPPSQNQLTPFNLAVGRRKTLNRIPRLRARTGKGRRLAR